MAFLGVALFALPAGIVGSGFVELIMNEKQAKQHDVELKRSPSIVRSPMHHDLEVLTLQRCARALQNRQPELAATLLEERLRALGAPVLP